MLAYRCGCYVFAAGLVVLAGCGGGPELTEVSGTVTMNGKSLEKIHVEFWPEGKDGPRSMGTTNDQGQYTLTTDDGKKKGALVGPHRVVLRDANMMEKFLGRAGDGADMSKAKKSRIAAHYGDPNKTPLKKEVKPGPQTIDLEVTP